MQVTITHNEQKYEVTITEWTKRPKANGIYIMLKNPVNEEVLAEVKNRLEAAFNVDVNTRTYCSTSTGFVVNNDDRTLSLDMIRIGLRSN